MIDIIIMTLGMLAFVALGFFINHSAQAVWWAFYEWRLSREDDCMLEEQTTEDKPES